MNQPKSDSSPPAKPIVFWGGTGQARVLRELSSALGFQLQALFDNDPKVSSPFHDIPLLHGVEGLRRWLGDHPFRTLYGLAAIGGSRGKVRLELEDLLRQHGITIASVVHPTAFVAGDVVLGTGSQILAHASLCAGVRLGASCIVNTGAIVDHECVLDKGVHIAPGAVLTGCVTVGAHTMIGAGAVVLPRTTIGRDAVIGAGAVVTKSIPDGVVAYGNPARVIRRSIS